MIFIEQPRCFQNGCAEGALECGSLLPLLPSELARVRTASKLAWKKVAASCRTPKRCAHFQGFWVPAARRA
jgi:hypothetical protein